MKCNTYIRTYNRPALYQADFFPLSFPYSYALRILYLLLLSRTKKSYNKQRGVHFSAVLGQKPTSIFLIPHPTPSFQIDYAVRTQIKYRLWL